MIVLGEFLADLEGFEWDTGNADKNWRNHEVRQAEAEQALLNRPVVFATDVEHSRTEARFFTLGAPIAADCSRLCSRLAARASGRSRLGQ